MFSIHKCYLIKCRLMGTWIMPAQQTLYECAVVHLQPFGNVRIVVNMSVSLHHLSQVHCE